MGKIICSIVKFTLDLITIFCSAFTFYLALKFFLRLSEEDEYDSDVYYFE